MHNLEEKSSTRLRTQYELKEAEGRKCPILASSSEDEIEGKNYF